MIFRVKGTVTYQNLEGGFWGILSDNKKYLVLNMPEQLKCDGLDIECTLRSADDVFTVFGWGTPVYIHGFQTTVFPK